MSSLIVEVSRIQEVNPHSNAERLELATIKGWQCVLSVACVFSVVVLDESNERRLDSAAPTLM